MPTEVCSRRKFCSESNCRSLPFGYDRFAAFFVVVKITAAVGHLHQLPSTLIAQNTFAWQPPYIRYMNTNNNSSIKSLQFFDYSSWKDPTSLLLPQNAKDFVNSSPDNGLARSSALKKVQQTRSAAASSTTLNDIFYEGVPAAAAAGAAEAQKQKKSGRKSRLRFLPQGKTETTSVATLQSACNPLSIRLQGTCSFHRALRGELTFSQHEPSAAVKIQGFLSGFAMIPPRGADNKLSKRHGMHIHTLGDIGNDCANTGDHFNPFSQHHGAPPGTRRHAGDLGNLVANENGTVQVLIQDSILTLYGPQSVTGRSLVIHAYEDDLGLQSTDATSLSNGNSGPPLDCCVIGLKSGSHSRR